MLATLSLEKTREILKYDIGQRDSFLLEKLKVRYVPPLLAPLGEILSNTLLVKSKATKMRPIFRQVRL